MKKKRLIGGLCMAVMLISVTACGGNSDTADSDNDSVVGEISDEDTAALVEDVSDGEETEGDASTETSDMDSDNIPLEFLIQTKSHYDYSDDDTYNCLYIGSYDLIHLTDDCKSAYPELSKALEAYNDETEGRFLESHDQMLTEAGELYNEMEDKEYFNGYSDEDHITLCRADDSFLSISANASAYMGGAHGMYGSGGYNYDVKSGKELMLKDVIADIPALQAIVKDKLLEEYGDEVFDVDLDEAIPEDLTGEQDQVCSWFITPQGIKITFGVYLLSSYAAGEQTVNIIYDEHPELFADGFSVQKGDYIEAYTSEGEYLVDIGQNGTTDKVGIEAQQYNEYDEFEGVEINVNGVKTSMEIYGYNIIPRFIHMGENTFLYLEISGEGDYSVTYAFRLEEGGAIKIGEYQGYLTGNTPENDYESEWESYWSVLLTSPDDLYFGTTMQMLSTYTGVTKAVINDKGELELPENYYYANFYGYDWELTAKQDINAALVDEKSHEITSEDGVIKAGSKITIIGTDGESYVDLKGEDDVIYRVIIKIDEWPYTINGVGVEELFDGMMYAG